jgi:acyl phosphate:glycerol-3-phosphate acyltransferase
LIELLSAVVFGYLLGSIPTAYLVARMMKGIDIRSVGSGNVGGSNVWLHAGKLPAIATLLFDLVKGALALSVVNGNGMSLGAQVAAGLAAIAGHDWPIWLHFVGGRGIATSGGVLFMFGPLETIITGIMLGVGAIGFKQGAVATLLAFACWPFMAVLFGRPPEVIACGALVWLFIVARRLRGSPGLKLEASGENVCWNRFWFDRDIRDEAKWVSQR